MTEASKPSSLSITELSANVVAETENPSPDVAKILGWMQDIVQVVGAGRNEQEQQLRDQTFLVAEQRFVDLHDVSALMQLLTARARWTGNRPAYGAECATILSSATKDRLVLSKIASVEFGKRRPLDSLSRLSFLLALKPGVAVADRTWGYGVVRREDDFYHNAEVVFDRDGAPRSIGFSFAADSLKIVPPTHLLSVRHADEAAFAKRCEEKPGEIVRLALESYGDMTVARLQTLLTDLALPKGTDWKKFWTTARSQLSRDPQVRVPPATKKNVPVELLRGAGCGSDEQAADSLKHFAETRDPKEALELAAAYLRDRGTGSFAPEVQSAFEDRLAFVMKCAVADRRLGNRAKFQTIDLALSSGLASLPVSFPKGASPYVLDAEFAFTDETRTAVDLAKTAARPDLLLDAAKTLPASQIAPLVEKLPLKTDAAMANGLVKVVPLMPPSLVDHVAPLLIAGPAADAFREMLLDQFRQDHPYNPDAEAQNEFEDADDEAEPKADGLSLPLLRWVCHAQAVEKDGLAKAIRSIVSPFAIVSLASVALGFPAEKENLRMKNDLKKLFIGGRRDPDPKNKGIEIDEGCKWLEPLMAEMSPEERASVFLRVQAIDGVWEPLKKRNLVAFLLRRWPELGANVPKEKEPEAKGFFQADVTSPRTYREREAQYRHLMDVEMPQNRKDIEFAKGFGDLSENFEYESARNKERELVARQTKLEEELKRVSAFDFDTVATVAPPESEGLVGLGSRVVLALPDGSEKVYSILGEWDSEPELGILSCSTPLAKNLLDAREGDSIELPSDGDEPVFATVKSVGALEPAILDWARG